MLQCILIRKVCKRMKGTGQVAAQMPLLAGMRQFLLASAGCDHHTCGDGIRMLTEVYKSWRTSQAMLCSSISGNLPDEQSQW